MNPGSPSPNRTGKSGFTLPEMLVALAAASILVLTMAAMLWYGFLGLTRTRKSVEMQRDMRASMVALAQMVHPATNLSFSAGVFTAQYSNRPPASVYSQATSNLFFDPNTSVAGDGMQLAYGTLRTFNVTVSTNLATVVLALGTSLDAVSNRVVFFRRN